MVLDLGGTAVRISEHNMNLSTRAGLEQALDFVRKEKPRWLWASFPGGPTIHAKSERAHPGGEGEVADEEEEIEEVSLPGSGRRAIKVGGSQRCNIS